MITTLKRTMMAAFVGIGLFAMASSPGWAATVGEKISDAVIARPVGAVVTVTGAALYVAVLPFALVTGDATSAGEDLVLAPYRFTVERPLGEPTLAERSARIPRGYDKYEDAP